MFEIESADPEVLRQAQTQSLFDFYRIVDVDTYSVYDWHDGRAVSTGVRCYEIWHRGSACKNCISRSCVLEGKRIVKLEYIDGQLFLIVALPLLLGGRAFSLELVCDVTKSLMVNDAFHTKNLDVQGLILQMNEAAVRDPYTQMFNKRYAEQELCKAVIEWDGQRRLGIAMLDIDYFKRINDTYGHLGGDEVLLALAQILTAYAEETNAIASRVGGDEFLLQWNDLSSEAERAMLREIEVRVADHVFTRNGEQFTVSISVGFADYYPEAGGWKTFLDRADQTMYRAKRQKYLPTEFSSATTDMR